MTAPNRYDELGPLTRPIIDRLINALASSPSTDAAAAYNAAYDALVTAADDAAAAYDAAYDAAREVRAIRRDAGYDAAEAANAADRA